MFFFSGLLSSILRIMLSVGMIVSISYFRFFTGFLLIVQDQSNLRCVVEWQASLLAPCFVNVPKNKRNRAPLLSSFNGKSQEAELSLMEDLSHFSVYKAGIKRTEERNNQIWSQPLKVNRLGQFSCGRKPYLPTKMVELIIVYVSMLQMRTCPMANFLFSSTWKLNGKFFFIFFQNNSTGMTRKFVLGK